MKIVANIIVSPQEIQTELHVITCRVIPLPFPPVIGLGQLVHMYQTHRFIGSIVRHCTGLVALVVHIVESGPLRNLDMFYMRCSMPKGGAKKRK